MPNPDSVQSMWCAYLQTIGEEPETTEKTSTAWHFCDNEQDADELAALVRAGRKRATASAYWTYEYEEEPIPEVGEYSVITDWHGEAQCVIRTISVEVVPFNEVTADFAATEGEGDRSLRHWREVHWAFFSRELESLGRQPDETMPVICEKFIVVYGQADS